MDIGGNLGYYSLLFAHRGNRVLYIEPLPRNYEAMQASLCMNPELQKRVTVLPIALSSETQAAQKTSTCRVSGAGWGRNNWGNGKLECGHRAVCAALGNLQIPCVDVQVE